MAETIPSITLRLTWDEGLQFTATRGEHSWVLDGDNEAGPSPVLALASALAGCMAIDVVHILRKGRHKVGALSADFAGDRSPVEPKRFTAVRLVFTVKTSAPLEAVERAIALSHEKYCSVWHSMRQDIDFRTAIQLEPLDAA